MDEVMEVRLVDSPWLTSTQARQYLQMGTNDFSKLAHSGQIRGYRRGRKMFFHAGDLDAWMMSLPQVSE